MTDTPSQSGTALLVAALRGLASRSPEAPCRDAWAEALAGQEGAELARQALKIHSAMGLWVGVRTAWIDARVPRLASIGGGVNQIVVLGAGLDTRPARLARRGLQFYEIDRPCVQRDKQQRLHGLESIRGAYRGPYPVDAARFVACDFTTADFVDALVEAGFDPKRPALIIWEGVTYLLEEASVLATLSLVAEKLHPRSTVVFDFLDRRVTEDVIPLLGSPAMKQLLEGFGDPIRFAVDDAFQLLRTAGFRHIRTIGMREACLSLTGSYRRHYGFGSTYIATASRAFCEDLI